MNFMASEYQGDAMMYRSKPVDVRVHGASNDAFAECESMPNKYFPRPMESAVNFSRGDIFATPDRSMKSMQQSKRNVTFKDAVEVQLLSPPSSNTSPLNNMMQAMAIDNSRAGSKTSPRNRNAASVRRCDSIESVDSSDATQESNDSMEPLDVLAHDNSTFPCTEDTPEHPLARPEFSSILELKRHRHKLETQQLNVNKVVSQKLKSEKTRSQLNDAAYRKLNRDDAMFSALPTTDVSSERVSLTEKVLGNRVTYKSAKPKASKSATPEQDIFDLFKPEFQKQSANFSVLSPDKLLAGAPQDEVRTRRRQAFHVYRHVRSWNSLDDK